VYSLRNNSRANSTKEGIYSWFMLGLLGVPWRVIYIRGIRSRWCSGLLLQPAQRLGRVEVG
jgi:hypothetical protein